MNLLQTHTPAVKERGFKTAPAKAIYPAESYPFGVSVNL
jgi:hypothetical protein